MFNKKFLFWLSFFPMFIKGQRRNFGFAKERLLTENAQSEIFQTCLVINGKPTKCVPSWKCPLIMKRSFMDLNLPAKEEAEDAESSENFFNIKENPRSLSYKNQCGKQKVELRPLGRIVGGTEAEIAEFPWVGWLQYENKAGQQFFACGCSLISPKWVVTAAHCIVLDKATETKPIYAIFGNHDIIEYNNCHSTEGCPHIQSLEISRTIIHESYNEKISTSPHDIALISLNDKAEFTRYVQPICLLTKDLPKDAFFWVSGWGKTEKGQLSSRKLKVGIPNVEIKKCKSVWKAVTNNQICAGGEVNEDSCEGDSGGPLMYQENNIWYLAGIVSYGHTRCGKPNTPAVYTKISNYVNWIKKQTEDAASRKFNRELRKFRYMKRSTKKSRDVY